MRNNRRVLRRRQLIYYNENQSSDAKNSENIVENQLPVKSSSKLKKIKPSKQKPTAKEAPNSSGPTVEESDNGGLSAKRTERTISVEYVSSSDVIRESSVEL